MRMPSKSEEAEKHLAKPPEERGKAVVEFERRYEKIGKPSKHRAIEAFDTNEEAVEYAENLSLNGSENFWDKVKVHSRGVDDIVYVRTHGEGKL